MSLVEITRQRQRLDDLFEKAKSLPDAEFQSHWSRYLCVLVSGFLENSVRITYTEYARRRANVSVADFVESRLRQFQNPKMGSILELAGGFSQEWKQRLENDTRGQLGESVNSIVGNRHKIAHGDSVGLSLHTLIQYYVDALKVVDLLRQQCGL
jgi:RiboL-PSP-HEPN